MAAAQQQDRSASPVPRMRVAIIGTSFFVGSRSDIEETCRAHGIEVSSRLDGTVTHVIVGEHISTVERNRLAANRDLPMAADRRLAAIVGRHGECWLGYDAAVAEADRVSAELQTMRDAKFNKQVGKKKKTLPALVRLASQQRARSSGSSTAAAQPPPESPSPVPGMRVAIIGTGFFVGSRSDIEETCRAHGIEVSSRLDGKVTHVIVGEHISTAQQKKLAVNRHLLMAADRRLAAIVGGHGECWLGYDAAMADAERYVADTPRLQGMDAAALGRELGRRRSTLPGFVRVAMAAVQRRGAGGAGAAAGGGGGSARKRPRGS